MATREELFGDLLDILEPDGRTSDVTYYTEGRAQEGEWANIIEQAFIRTEAGSPERQAFIDTLDNAGFFKESDNLDFWVNTATVDNQLDINDLERAAEERFPTLLADASDVPAGEPAFADPTPGVITPVGDEGTPGIMAGGTVHRVRNEEGQEDFYVVSYEYPPGSGHAFYYRFNDLETLQASIGTEMEGVTVGGNIPEDQLNQWTDAGDSNEVVGVTGSFTGYINDIINQVSIEAGIGDPTRLGKALLNPEIQIVMAKAAEGGFGDNDARIKALLRQTDYYKDVIYPGIENFYGMTDNPEAAYNMYKQNINSNLQTLGIPKDADGSYDTTLKQMLDAGISDTEFNRFTPTYLRAAGNDGYRQNLNQWLTAAGVSTLDDFDSLYDVLAGTEPQEVKDIVELAGISYVAGETGLGVGTDLIKEIAERTDLTEAQITERFLASDRDLLSLGVAGLRTSGLTQEDIISTRAGFTTGDRSIGEMENLISKVKREQGIADDPTATIFTDFNREGAPIKKGLASTISEGA